MTTPEPEFDKPFAVLTISRAELRTFGLPDERISRLSDEDMEQIAEELQNRYILNDFAEDVVFVAKLVLAERQGYEQKPLTTDPGAPR